MGKTFSIISLGCFRNSYDSEIIILEFSKLGYRFLPSVSLFTDKKNKIKTIDLLIVNTCGFIDKAKEESIKIISEAIDLKKKNRVGKIMVMGCLVKRYQEELEKAYPLVDSWQSVVEFRQDFVKRDKSLFLSSIGFLKICEGCLNRCSFCAIPSIKGPLRSKFKSEVIKEAKDLEKKGVRELNIIGQDITSWGKDLKGKEDLASLLKGILRATKEIKWIRLIYTHPKHFNDSLINIIAKEGRICKYIDLPIQHINDRILKLMNRGIAKKEIIDLIDKIRKRIPGCVIRSSVIVGFPTESEKEFKELLDFLKYIKIDRLGAFIYSQEKGTQAYKMRPQVHHSTKKRRFKEIMEQQQEIAREGNKRFLNKELDILIEDKDSGMFVGRSQYDALDVDGMVFLRKKGLKVGNFYKAKIIDCLGYDLIGV
ncbi:MAG: 30S ribosomal protein S12 methylthiotransferase RimO [Candidatus Omnitrophica bacterium]|nr:30S ribosomal protein S12 methylthiotransferase RimO [Candidatus Omnitrophota bacterium]